MLQVSVLGPWAMVALSGEFDIVNSDGIRVAVDELVDQGVTDVTIDLSSTTFIGAATLNALVAANNRISSVGGRLMTVGLVGLSARIFDATDLAATLSAFTAPLGMAPVADSLLLGDTDDVTAAAATENLVRNFFQLSLVLLREPTVTGDLDRIVQTATSAPWLKTTPIEPRRFWLERRNSTPMIARTWRWPTGCSAPSTTAASSWRTICCATQPTPTTKRSSMPPSAC